MNKTYCVYILASKRNGTLYIGVTNNLVRRMWEHRNKISHGFTKKYEISLLVHYEVFEDPSRAIEREKQLKKWNRAWKIKLIEENNKEWNDLYESLG
ncbi:MAG: GIY-YIG nuclease family protein [Candidatus Jacksonbacteria bacterium]|jgi:putative endonuclease|nr:GIY-YIG nuclease family protein [Candidatus Jacksonbacteria bacterium]MBT6034812.1 GIY-YIG nuclease family protein [Candidatus Jacksonbacteria bacterium]MBT6301494.1 GIY-YIG nuclease family protein [Candidatus Jacksonbacteria bacterium]MBT6757545.1 GIY-YIG nuclease family protein [Candidatus Jacksonbacteria bacterium]MBT6955070.1 GIY-YIG nuclease family protein [Candidatus Jacksonbacteria bacterium]